jgi:hypothetical protein
MIIKRVDYFISITIISLFILWAELSPNSLADYSREDGFFENLSAIFFGLSSLIFGLAIKNNKEYFQSKVGLGMLATLAWVILMFIFMGEEISWGQRIFSIETPEALMESNLQQEFNIHNLAVVDNTVGGKYRFFSLMLLSFGLIFPIMKFFTLGKKTLHFFAFPAPSLGLGIITVAAYIFGKYYFETLPMDAASEIREFIFSVAVLILSIQSAFYPKKAYILESS